MKTSQMDYLIETRPMAYGWLGFQKMLLWVFLCLGILFFICTVFTFLNWLAKEVIIMAMSSEIAQHYSVKEEDIKAILIKHLNPIQRQLMLGSFLLSLFSFIISRYCHKVIKRNNYILKLEVEWKRFKEI